MRKYSAFVSGLILEDLNFPAYRVYERLRVRNAELSAFFKGMSLRRLNFPALESANRKQEITLVQSERALQ